MYVSSSEPARFILNLNVVFEECLHIIWHCGIIFCSKWLEYIWGSMNFYLHIHFHLKVQLLFLVLCWVLRSKFILWMVGVDNGNMYGKLLGKNYAIHRSGKYIQIKLIPFSEYFSLLNHVYFMYVCIYIVCCFSGLDKDVCI